MMILNLGCGTKTSAHPNVHNIDWSPYLRLKSNPILRKVAPLLLSGVRRQRFDDLPTNIRVHNLVKGIPYPDGSADAVYHSHLYEHLERESGIGLLREVMRVLKPGGIHRIALPDFYKLASDYLESYSRTKEEQGDRDAHEKCIARMIEQCVRREGAGTSSQKGIVKFLDRVLLGDARKRGETHRWMYDGITLGAIMESVGYVQIETYPFNSSGISDWPKYGLEIGSDGKEYKDESLYIEGIKPS